MQLHSNLSWRNYPSPPSASQLYFLYPLKNQDMALMVHPETCSVKAFLIVPYNEDDSAHGHSSVACVDHEHMHRTHWPELRASPTAWMLLNLPTALLTLSVNSSLLTKRVLLTEP